MNEGVKSNVSFGNKQIQQYIKPQHNKIYFSCYTLNPIVGSGESSPFSYSRVQADSGSANL